MTVINDDFGDTIETSSDLQVGFYLVGLLEYGGDEDVFRVHLVAGRNYYISMNGLLLGDPVLWLYGPAKNFITFDDDSGFSLDSRLNYKPTVTGDYYLKADSYSSLDHGSYTLLVEALSVDGPDDFAGATSTVGVAPVGGSVTGVLGGSQDKDWFRVSLTGGHTYRFDLQGSSSGYGTVWQPELAVRSESGTELAHYEDTGVEHDARGFFTAPGTGTFYLEARLFSGAGDYRLSVADLSSGGSTYVGGGAGADTLNGSSGKDALVGFAGDDRLKGLAGDDEFDGGEGIDTAVFTGPAASYDWWRRSDGFWTVNDRNGAGSEGRDILLHVEKLEFSDQTVTIDGSLDALMIQAYRNLMRKAPTGSVGQFNSELDFVSTQAFLVAAQSQTKGVAFAEIVQKADATTAVATMSYQFFLGFVPTGAGLDYLVSPTGPNPNNLNAAYYQSFNIENRYINFAVNLGKSGEGAQTFLAEYGAKTLFQATKDAYAEIFGGTPADAKVSAILDAKFTVAGKQISRAEYFASYGGDGLAGIGTKAAMVGWLLTEAIKADVGLYALSSNAFLVDLADGAETRVDIIGVYGHPEWAFSG